MQLRWFMGLASSLVVLGMVACSSESSFDEAPTVPLEELPAKYAAALCQAYESCLGQITEVYLPGEDCVTRTSDRIADGFGSIEAAVEAKRIEYNGARVEACIKDLGSRSCEELLERDSDACSEVLVGSVADGQDCSQSEECAGTAYCNFESSCPGTCSALETMGSACKQDSQCVSGLVCSQVTERCVKPVGLGDLCEGGEPECMPGYVCKGASEEDGTSGNCRGFDDVFAAGSGEPCDIKKANLCKTDFSCAIDSVGADGALQATCAPKVGSGDTCKIAFPSMCPADQYCDVPAALPVVIEGACKPSPDAGEPCAKATPFDMAGTVCGPYARCDGGTCRALAGLGEGCETSAVCMSEHCEGGACVSGDACE